MSSTDERPAGEAEGPGSDDDTELERSGDLEQTSDDTDAGWGEAPDPRDARDAHERWLRDQRPPHWG